MKANRVFLASGIVITTEPDSNPNRCADCEEISRVEVDVPEGTLCDICEEEIIEVRQRQTKSAKKPAGGK